MPTDDTPPKPEKIRAPEWALQPFRDFLDYTDHLGGVVDLSVRSLSLIPHVPEAVKALAMAEDSEQADDTKRSLDIANKQAEFAQQEISAGFPFLHNQAAVSLWSALESLLHTCVSQWILNRPEILQQEPLANVRLKIGDYVALDQEQQAYYLADMLEQSLAAPLKSGITRFEAVFTALGLGGCIDPSTRQTLYELQQVRNVVLHKRGIADQKFCMACPWLNIKPGTHVAVSQKMLDAYFAAAGHYIVELIYRTGEFFGVPGMRAKAEAATT
jgi:hypothetical protein